MKKILSIFLALIVLFPLPGCKDWDTLSEQDKATLDRTLAHWETWIPARKADGTAPVMTFKDLYQGLDPAQTDFLDRIRAIHPSDKDFDPSVAFKRIENQQILRKGKPEILAPQYLPQNVYDAYETMMAAMKRDLGKRLWVESGYRSPAYQLYTFLYYTPKHNYSIKETNRWVAFPGHSEHGDPSRQASDYINEQGINGDTDFGQVAEDFERLPEYEWLQKHAGEFGFEISYPRGTKGTSFEPWHWRYLRSK